MNTLRTDKAYAVTADGKLVPPTHSLARQILSHEAGQEVPVHMLKLAGLTTGDDKDARLQPREYDEIADPASGAAKTEPAPTAPSLTIDDVLTSPALAEAVNQKIGDAVKEALAEADKKNAEATKKLIAEALKAAGVGK